MKILFIYDGKRRLGRNKRIAEALRKKGINVQIVFNKGWSSKLKSLALGDYDIIYTQHPFLESVIAGILGKLRGKKITCLIRGYDEILNARKYGIKKRIAYPILSWISFRLMDHVFFISKDAMRKVTTKYRIKNWSIAPNGIDIPKYEKINLRKYIKEKKGITIKDTDVIIATATNLSFKEKAKGISILMEAVSDLSHTFLLVFGEGKYTKYIPTNQKNVILMGYRKPIYDWIAGADIFAYCSLLDSFGMTSLEAQAAKLPVVASNIGGIPETGKHVILAENTAQDFAKKLLPLINSKQLSKELGEKNYKWASQRSFAWAVGNYIKEWRKYETEN